MILTDPVDFISELDDDPPLNVLIAESNPAAAQILETLLRHHLNCRCVRVKTGCDVVACAMGEIKFDIIFCDINLPVCKCVSLSLTLSLVSGEGAARMIKTTTNINSNTPIVALSCTRLDTLDFNHVIIKPVTRVNVVEALHCLYITGQEKEEEKEEKEKEKE